jgi:hypothetical protein
MTASTHVAACGLHAVRSLAVAGLLLSAGIVSAQDAAIAAFKTVDSMEARSGLRDLSQSGQGTSNEYFSHRRQAGRYLPNLRPFATKRKNPPMNYLVAYLPDAIQRSEHFLKECSPSRLQQTTASAQ